jgi:DNA-binding GntR family transcriptional regulator
MKPLKASPPLKVRVTEAMREAIVRGELKPGAELNQEQLARKLGVSRIPIREALQLLERDGLVIVQSNRRVIVVNPTDEDLADQYRLRALVEGEAAALAAQHPEDLADVLAALELSAGKPSRNRFDYVSKSELFHRAIWHASHSPRLAGVAAQSWTGLAPYTPLLIAAQRNLSIDEHARIVAAIKNGDSDAARAEMTAHILRSAAALLDYRRLQRDASEPGTGQQS